MYMWYDIRVCLRARACACIFICAIYLSPTSFRTPSTLRYQPRHSHLPCRFFSFQIFSFFTCTQRYSLTTRDAKLNSNNQDDHHYSAISGYIYYMYVCVCLCLCLCLWMWMCVCVCIWQMHRPTCSDLDAPLCPWPPFFHSRHEGPCTGSMSSIPHQKQPVIRMLILWREKQNTLPRDQDSDFPKDVF